MGRSRSAHAADGESRLTASWLAWLVSAVAAVFGILFLLLLLRNSTAPQVETYDYWLASAVMAIVFPLVGALIVSRSSATALGWVFCATGFFTAAGDFGNEYATYALLVEPGSLPGGVWAAWVGSFASDMGFLALPLIPLLFPGGRAFTHRWRPVIWFAGGSVAVVGIGRALMPGALQFHATVQNPVGIDGAGSAIAALLDVAFGIAAICLIAAIACLILRFRSSSGSERQQIKWFTFAISLAPLGLVGNTLFPDLAWLIGGISLTLIPAAVGIAVLKYRLYEIDVVINRTLVYGALTVGVVGLYVLVVGGLGSVLQARGTVVSILAAGLIAVLFQPVHARLQRAVNHLMYGERDDPYSVLSRLGQRLGATISPDAVMTTVVETVAVALKLPYAAIELKQGDDSAFTTVAEYGRPSAGEPLALPLVHGTETIGHLVLFPRTPGEPFGPTDRRLLNDLARQAEAAVQTVRLTHDLQRSRARLVNVREEERRRMRRDLHDGLGPQLATVTLKLDAARNLLASQPSAADALLAELKTHTQAAIADIRRVVYDLRPPTLDDLGLIPAIREQAANYSQNGLNIVVDAPECLPSLPAAVEVAAYRITQEALTNVVRHARARNCCIKLSLCDELVLEIVDDGVGLPVGLRAGVGLSSMRERAAELGGACSVTPAFDSGTRVITRLPLPAATEVRR